MHLWAPCVYFPLLIILWIQRPLVISKTSDADGKLANWDREKEKKGWEGTSSLQAHSFILHSLLSRPTPALRVQKKENRVFGADACLFFFSGGGGRNINLTPTVCIFLSCHAARVKGIVHLKRKFCHHLLTLVSLQTHLTFSLLWNTKWEILRNVLAIVFNIIKVKEAVNLQNHNNTPLMYYKIGPCDLCTIYSA